MTLNDWSYFRICSEFLQEEHLYQEVGLESLPQQLADRLSCDHHVALERASQIIRAGQWSRDEVQLVLAIRDMTWISQTVAYVSTSLSPDGTTYERCCRIALCYAVANMEAHVFAALRAAASKNDEWARHHYLYGLVLLSIDDTERALFEFGLALKFEPYEEARVAIREAIDVIERSLAQSRAEK